MVREGWGGATHDGREKEKEERGSQALHPGLTRHPATSLATVRVADSAFRPVLVSGGALWGRRLPPSVGHLVSR